MVVELARHDAGPTRQLDAEAAADVLWAHGAAAIEEQERDGRTILLGGFEVPDAATAAAAAVGGAGRDVLVRPVLDDGADAWRPHAEVVRAGPFVLVPAWLEVPAVDPEERVLRLDPDRTFGSGSHPTTRLVLQCLDRLDGRGAVAGRSVLDVGTGSGVLAVAARMLGAAPVVAIDVDPGAPAATDANARRNGVDGIESSTTALHEVIATTGGRSPFDLVLANLLAPVVAELAPDLVAATGPRGRLVVSGLLEDRWPASTDRLAPLVVEEVLATDGWVAVVLRHP